MTRLPRTTAACLFALFISLSLAATVSAEDWLRFRGPNGSGVSADTAPVPAKWSATENLKWKVALPGPGHSCPIIVGDRVFVTCWSGYGVDRGNPGQQEDLKRHLICLDRKDGKTIWDKSVSAVLPEDRYGGMFAEHGYASHTPVSDGKRVFVFFGKSGALAFDLEGNQLWQTPCGDGTDPRGWGSSCSPILYKNLVIITASAESTSMFALDQETGKEVWKQQADGFNSTWGTPLLVKVDDSRTDLVLGVPYEIWGFNPDTGKLRWYCEAMDTDSYCSSVVADGAVVFGVEGRGGGSIAVKAGGKDDVTKTHVVWSGRDNNRIGTPLIHDGRMYFFSNRVANCIDLKTGERVFQGRLENAAGSTTLPAATPAPKPADAANPPRRGPGGFGGGMGGQDYASPVLADGKIIFVSRGGDMYVIKAGDKFEQLSVNRVTADREDFSASPAVSDGQIFIRSSKHLYCIAEAAR